MTVYVKNNNNFFSIKIDILFTRFYTRQALLNIQEYFRIKYLLFTFVMNAYPLTDISHTFKTKYIVTTYGSFKNNFLYKIHVKFEAFEFILCYYYYLL